MFLRQFGTFLLALLGQSVAAGAQETQEFWPEVQAHIAIDKATKVIASLAPSRSRETREAYQVDGTLLVEHIFTPWFRGRVGYRHAEATDGGRFREDRLMAEQTFRLELPVGFLIDFRTREDFRFLDTGYSTRLRERAQLQRDTTIADYTFTPYASAEIYWDSRYDRFARYRLIGGVTFPIGKSVAFEPYYARQVDFYPSDNIVNAWGLVVYVYF